MERLNLIDFENRILPITTQAKLLSLNRTSLYYRPAPPSPWEIAIKNEIDRIYTDDPYMGSRPITTILNRTGFSISRPTVQKYMREMGISAIYPKPNLSKKITNIRYFHTSCGVKARSPNHVWGTDITYTLEKRLALPGGLHGLVFQVCAVWELDFTLEVDFVLEALGKALEIARPEIINSDQGSQYTSNRYIEQYWPAKLKSVWMDGGDLWIIFSQKGYGEQLNIRRSTSMTMKAPGKQEMVSPGS